MATTIAGTPRRDDDDDEKAAAGSIWQQQQQQQQPPQREDVVVMDSSDDDLPRPPASAGRSPAPSAADAGAALPERGSFSRQRRSTMPPRAGTASGSRQPSSSRGGSVETASTARGTSAGGGGSAPSPAPAYTPATATNASAAAPPTASPSPPPGGSEGSSNGGGGGTIGSAEVRALLDDAKDVLVLLTKEIVRLRNEKCEYELRLRDEELVQHRTRVAELDESYLKRFGPKASPLPSLDNGGALDRGVLVSRLADAEAKAADLDRKLRKKKGETDRLRAELKEQVDARQEDLAAIQKLARQSAAVAAKLDAANNDIAASKKREEALKRRANEVTSQVREATRGTIESLEQALSEALEHNRILGAELALAKREGKRAV